MRVGTFLFGGVEMDDAGSGPPASTDRRYDNDVVWHATERLVDAGLTAERLGYDSYWLTEHHFQYEGYEVVPNGLMLGAIIAERTERIRLGMAFNIIPQWNPLRFAEDFATLHGGEAGQNEVHSLVESDPEARHTLVGDRKRGRALVDQSPEKGNHAAARTDDIAVADNGEPRTVAPAQMVRRGEYLVRGKLAGAVEVDRIGGLVGR